VPKTAFLGLRINPELKKQLEAIAEREERSISQVCEVLLRGGVAAYKSEGTRYLQQLLAKKASKDIEVVDRERTRSRQS
jgi:hypothetical protein